ncbi:putative bifunctional diguanylate cyclase/phosphodiesterase [Massilia horti]|uniref:EAL domain-containing protein n=1 Tax=Massilia horti TaxID=2562153 RepID=A0A4Y9SXD5_9BURK|nr:EAL domain-containing protein [Massilia horti]TFW31522.1 EAL domain-containing protein [Massilia horti]
MSEPSSSPSEPLPSHAHRVVVALTRLLSVYLIPIGVALLSVFALATWNSHYRAGDRSPLLLRVMAETGAPLTPQAALHELARAPALDHYTTRLSEAPVWFALRTVGRAGQAADIEFPSRHAVAIRCWDGDRLQPLGSAWRGGAEGALTAAKAGFVLQLAHPPAQVLCRATFSGPARLSAVQWPPDQMTLSVQQFHRKSGLLDGGMIVLSLFVLITALINRQVLYLQFAGWLILNLRVGAISAGWDIQWLGQELPPEWLTPSRAVTTALYAISTLTLYMTLFWADVARSRFATSLRLMQWVCLPLLALSLLLPFRIYLPVMWVLVVAGLALMTCGLVSVMRHSQARVALWFAGSFAVTFLSSLAEVIAAALGMSEVLGVANSVTAALASSLLAALAVAEQMRLETEKRIAAQAELEHAYEAMPVGLLTLDLEGHFLSANPALCRMLDCDVVVPGRTLWRQFFDDDAWRSLLELVRERPNTELEIDTRERGRRFLVRATLARGRIEGVLEDITEKTKATEQLRFMANNDPLTKVFNRRGIERMFEGATVTLASGLPLALAYLDLDRFKLINDLFGHAAGDEVLRQVCDRMALVLGGGQKIGRVGGDEFVIVMPDTSIALATLVCRTMVERIGGQPYRVGDKAFHVRGSIGLIEVSSGMPMKDAVSAADRACREAKEGAADGLVVYERNARAFREREAELNLVARLAGPNATDGMFLEMQPIMSLKAPRASLNFEVLLRMREPDGRVVGAGPIIGAAEKSGHVGVIDRWVLTSTLQWIAAHEAELANTRFVCMNLSGASLNDERFVQDTIDILAHHAHVADRLCMEITESVALHDLDNTRRFIDQVRAYGVKVALDDFGAGYTSFSYLKELPADVLKIDGNFVVNINAHPANVAIVEAIVNLAVNLGMKTIAEWAEDAATVQTLAEIGVDYVQGWAVSRPQLPERVLTAGSSAGFIQDEQVLQLVDSLETGQRGEMLALFDLR